jgi:hypothetical protein
MLSAAHAKITAVDRQIAELTGRRHQLGRLVETCGKGNAADCVDLTAPTSVSG